MAAFSLTGFFDVCSGIVMLLALPLFDKSNKWSIELPNAANFSFHFPTFLRIYMLAFFAGTYNMEIVMYI
jgi:very-long-chain (3R)-3-hydroxyacyl-CoA dehydratase